MIFSSEKTLNALTFLSMSRFVFTVYCFPRFYFADVIIYEYCEKACRCVKTQLLEKNPKNRVEIILLFFKAAGNTTRLDIGLRH